MSNANADSGKKLEDALKSAYDAMNPAPDQEERMLAFIAEAQAQASGQQESASRNRGEEEPDADGATAAAGASASAHASGKTPKPKRLRAAAWWKAALPLAACLVVGAVVVGVAGFGVNPESADPAQSTTTPAVQEENALLSSEASAASDAETAVTSAKTTMEDAAVEEAMEADGAVASTMDAEDDGYYDDAADVDFNTEEYDAVDEPGFVSTKSRPLSTVSADVDTASYCNLRRMMNDGYALSDIPSGAVRIEEMLNYFDYDYPTVTCGTGGDKFSMQAQAAQCPWNKDTQLLVLGFAAAEESQAASKGSNLVFLIDVSGSMDDPDKLDLLQDSFATLLESLGPDDRVSIVTYANGEDIVLEGAHGDDDKAILRAMHKLRAEGSTNGEAGLKQAYEVAERNFIEGGVNRIVMASDGDLNVGMTSESDLYEFVDGKRESGIYLSVLGFGAGNYKDNKMETLADHGNGSYHYIDCIDEAERVLKTKLTANLVPFADDVKVQVEFNPGQVKAYRLIGYENRAMADEDFRDDAADAGDVGPGAQFTLAYEVVLADSPMELSEPDLKYGNGQVPGSYANASSDWLTCSLRYHAFDGDEMREQQLVADASNVAAQPSDDWKFAAAVIEFGMLARDSEYAGTSSTDAIVDLLGTNLPDERDAFKRLVLKAA